MNNSDIILVYHGLRKLFLTGERVRRQQKFLEKKSEKAFSQIKWIGSYETESEEKYVDNDLRARREVNKFMQGRMRAILTDGFIVPGITARYAVQSKLIYHRENDYYE